jgi:DNA polymerase III subunit gamma/tau
VSLALYRKYRPASFAEVVGQEHVTGPLRSALSNGRIHHAYLFSGPRGCGKTSSARILARSLNCAQGPTPDPCGACASCVALAPNGPGSLDVIEIDAASHNGVDDARDLRERAFFAPVSERYKIYIIDEAHMVTSAAFNALLKLVEEPPEFVKFVFATTEPEKVLQTIRSRTHHYPFRLMPRKELTDLLTRVVESEGVAVEQGVLPLVVRAAAGSARDGLSILDQVLASHGTSGVTREAAAGLLGVTPDTLLDDVVDAFAARDAGAVFAAVDTVMERGNDPRRFASDVLERLRDLVVLDAVPDAGGRGLLDCPADQLERMSRQAAAMGTAGLSRAADLLHEGLVEMRGTTSPRLLLELVCARVLLPAASSDTPALLTRLERLERRLEIGAPGGSPPPPTPPHVPGPPHAEHPAGTSLPQARPVVPASAPPPSEAPPSEARTSARAQAPAGPASDGPPARQGPGGQAAGGQVAGGQTSRGQASPAPGGQAAARPGPSQDAPAGGWPTAAVPGAPQAPSQPAPQAPAGGDPAAAAGAGAGTAAGAVAARPSGAEPDAAPAGGLDAAAVRRAWDEVLAVVRSRSRPTHALLAEVSVASLAGRTLTLAFRHAPLMRQFQSRAGVDVVQEALQEVLGADLDVACSTGQPDHVPAAAAPAMPGVGPPPSQPPPVHEGFAPGDEAVPEDPDAPPPPESALRGEDAALALVERELGGRVVGTSGEA